MMKKHAVIVILAAANMLMVAAFAPPDAAAQPQPILVLSPASGPCDATVQVIGSGYPAGAAINISLLRPHSEGDFAVLASASATPSGDFQVAADLALGSVGCDVAALDDQLDDRGEPKELFILAYVPPTSFVGGSAYATYTYTTTMAGTPRGPTALPGAGTGPEAPSASALWLGLAGTLAAIGLLLVAASLHRSGRLRK